MELARSTLTGHTGGVKAGLRRLAARILGESYLQSPPTKLAALLLPMVRRVVRTQCGPAALVRWLRGCSDSPVGGQMEWTLAEDLARFLLDQPELAETIDDSR